MMEEVWKDISEWVGYYQISNRGRVRSLDREFYSSDGRFYRRFGRILRLIPDKNGYLMVYLTRNSKAFTRKVHRLVAAAFIGDPTGLQINHLNGQKDCNEVWNLEIVTLQQNRDHAVRAGLICRGDRSPMSKLKEHQVRAIRQSFATGEKNQMELAEIYGVTHKTISKIVNYQRWKHI